MSSMTRCLVVISSLPSLLLYLRDDFEAETYDAPSQHTYTKNGNCMVQNATAVSYSGTAGKTPTVLYRTYCAVSRICVGFAAAAYRTIAGL